jgi:YggT family protein
MIVVDVLRYAVFAIFAGSALVALGSWAVRTRRLNPFSRVGQLTRKLSDPVLEPIERLLHQRGGNPQNAGWWLLGGSIIGGIVLVTLVDWMIVQMVRVAAAGASGPVGILRLTIAYAGRLVTIALIVRVFGTWFGKGRHTKWMRPFYVLTDWIVEPLRRVIPPLGGQIDITPIVAYLLLEFLILPVLLNFLLR